MPKREVQVIAHAVLTNHRIVAQAEEPYPDAAFHMTTPQMPDLVHLTEIPGQTRRSSLADWFSCRPTASDGLRIRNIARRYFASRKIGATDSNNVDVLRRWRL